MGRTPPAPRARRRRIEQSPRWQSPSTRVALNTTGTNVEIHTTPTKREPEDGPKSSFHLRPPVGLGSSAPLPGCPRQSGLPADSRQLPPERLPDTAMLRSVITT